MQSMMLKICSVLFLSSITKDGYEQNISKDSLSFKNDFLATCKSTLNYPDKAAENSIYGTVIVAFDIDTNCSILNIRVEKGIGYGCDEEALRVVNECKKQFSNFRKSRCIPRSILWQSFTFV